MANHHPATTIKVVSVQPHGDGKVRITMELTADVHRLAEVGGEMLRTAMTQVKAERGTKKKK